MSQDELIFEVAYLCRSGKGFPKKDDLKRCLAQVEGLESPTKGSSVYRYRNLETQVAFEFVLYEPDGDAVGLSFEMGMPRPLFFALEALPCVVQVARELSLDVEILSPENEIPASEPTLEILLDQWQRANREEAQALEAEGVHLHRFDNPGLEATWEFMLLRAEMARRYSRVRVAVPPVQFLRHRNSGKVHRAVQWTGLQPIAVAECELVVLLEPPAPLKNKSVIAFDDLRNSAKFAFRDLSQPVVHRLFDKQKALHELPQVLATLETQVRDDFEELPYRLVLDKDLTPLMDD